MLDGRLPEKAPSTIGSRVSSRKLSDAAIGHHDRMLRTLPHAHGGSCSSSISTAAATRVGVGRHGVPAIGGRVTTSSCSRKWDAAGRHEAHALPGAARKTYERIAAFLCPPAATSTTSVTTRLAILWPPHTDPTTGGSSRSRPKYDPKKLLSHEPEHSGRWPEGIAHGRSSAVRRGAQDMQTRRGGGRRSFFVNHGVNVPVPD